jgi:hypothetical protein
MSHKSYRYGGFETQLWHLRGDDFIEDPESDLDEILRERGRSAAMRQESYDDFLASNYWERVKAAMHMRHNSKCQQCGTSDNLQVHHKKYPRRGTELQNLHLLELLCESCHHQLH